MALSTRYLAPGQAPSSPFFPSLFFSASAGGRPGALFPSAAPGGQGALVGMLFGREGPDLGPVGSSSSPTAFPMRGPGAYRNESGQGEEGVLSGAEGDLGMDKGWRQVQDPGGKGRYPREVTATAYFPLLNILSQWDPGLTCG